MNTKTAMLAVLALALTACSVKTDNNEVVAYGDRIPARIMCPGVETFAGYYANTAQHTGLTDSNGRPIGAASKCVWVKT